MPTYRLKDEYRIPKGEPVGYEVLLQDISQQKIISLLSIRGGILSHGYPEGNNIFSNMFEIVKDKK
tara:strand:- start:1048 stop:1245 length:198 start_codon:yes stop_codon:yes gene_type:complete